jgi:hypothetical protein
MDSIDKEKDLHNLKKYERMLEQLYVFYAEERKTGRILQKDSELYKKIQRGKMLVEEWKRQRACNIY